MTPKAFPFPIGVGVDICHINRIAAIFRREHLRNRWVRRVFTRLEWPALQTRFDRANASTGLPLNQIFADNDRSSVDRSKEILEGNEISTHSWSLPKLSEFSSRLEDADESIYWSAIADERSTLRTLIRHLAGRWAAKEAVIKAHDHRKLYMQDVSILGWQSPLENVPLEAAKSHKLQALVDPPGDTILMDGRVAKIRGLKEVKPQNERVYGGQPGRSESEKMKKEQLYERRSKIEESDRQLAKINISHDGEYAVAVCVAFDSQDSSISTTRIVDHGEGPPIHEPQWGDEGWSEENALIDSKEGS